MSFSFVFVCALACLVQSTIGQVIGLNNALNYGLAANNLGSLNGLGFGANTANALAGNLAVNGLGGNLALAANGLSSLAGNGCSLNGLSLGGLQSNAASGYGEVTITGEVPVGGTTAVAGNVPVIGYVTFEGNLPAGGIVSVANENNCGCGRSNQFLY